MTTSPAQGSWPSGRAMTPGSGARPAGPRGVKEATQEGRLATPPQTRQHPDRTVGGRARDRRRAPLGRRGAARAGRPARAPRERPLPQPPPPRLQAGRRPAPPDDPGGEGRPDDAGRTRSRRREPGPITELRSARCCPAAARRPPPNTPQAWADMVDGYQSKALATRAADPADLRRRLRARPRQPRRRDGLPAQHRAGRHPRPRPRPAERRRSPRRRPGRPASSGTSRPCVCVTRDERWGRSYEAFGEDPALVAAMETGIDGLPGRPSGRHDRPSTCSPRSSTTPVTATRRTARPPPAATPSTRASRSPTAGLHEDQPGAVRRRR